MPYNNPYNRKIAREVEGLNKSYIKNIGDYYPLEGGGLDTGYESDRIIGGAMDEYVRNVLSGSLNVPTQAMHSSSMSGMGFSAGMREYMKGSGFSGGYAKGSKLTQEKKELLKATREFNKTFGINKEKVYKKPSEKVMAKRLAILEQGDLLRQVPKTRKQREVRGMFDLEKLNMPEMKKIRAEERLKKQSLALFEKQMRKEEREQKRQERGFVPKKNPWISFVKNLVVETGRNYRDLIRDPMTKDLYNREKERKPKVSARKELMEQYEGLGMSGGWAYKGQKLGLARRDGVKKRDYGEPYKNRGKGVPRQLQQWQNHLERVKSEYPDLRLKEILQIAKESYEPVKILPRPSKRKLVKKQEQLEFM